MPSGLKASCGKSESFVGEVAASLTGILRSLSKTLPTDYISPGKSHGNEWRGMEKMGGKNQIEGTLIEPPPKPPNPCHRHSPSSPRPNLRSPPVVFSVTGSRGEGSLEYHQDPRLGNSAVDPTLAVKVCWRRRGDVAAATTTVEPPSEYSEDRTSKARTTAVLPRSPVLAVLPRNPVFPPCHSFSPSVQLQPPLTTQGRRHSSH
ncbi:hypothetical protein PIB30_081673 [Stylosanthes scabra]|uniref:Uncharacterized protein n=1 Tax=Stylosanthes scabra TaxID=79078 RepID=A0ABU6XRK4_9FABA|nr:hypothetical protein [Stylosanthes scabra]